MDDDMYALALKNVLNEIKNVCPDVSHGFVFNEKHELVAKDQNTNEGAIRNTAIAFCAVAEMAETIGGVDSVTFQGTNGRVNITNFNDFYLTTVASNEADEKTVTNLTRVLVPTMLKLTQKITPTQEISEENTLNQQPETPDNPEPYTPEPIETEFTVENLGIGGMLGPTIAVRIDRALIAQWNELYGNNKIKEVIIEETTTRNSLRCKFKLIKESKYEAKGLIQMSESAQRKLKTKKGAQVLIKPVIKNQDDTDVASDETELPAEESTLKADEGVEVYRVDESSLPAPLVSQFMVEDLKGFGFLRNSDTVRIDPGVIQEWKELYGGKKIEELIVEDTITGTTLRCKFKPIKDSKFEDKGMIQIPEKAQLTLQTRKGALVMIKPVIE
jgi:hypothetical protein